MHRICITIKYCCRVIVIPFHAQTVPGFFRVANLLNFQFSVWICMWTRYCSENGFPLAEHVTRWLTNHRAVSVVLSQSRRCALFFRSCVVIICNRFLCWPMDPHLDYRFILSMTPLTLSLLMSYISYMELLVKPEILTSYIYIYMDPCLATLKAVSICCTMFQHWISAESYPVAHLCVKALLATKVTLITNGI
jgi:hypothetical protein